MARICVITSTFPASAGSVAQAPFAVDTIQKLVRLGHEITVLTQSTGASTQDDWKDFSIVRYPWADKNISAASLLPLRRGSIGLVVTLLGKGAVALAKLQSRKKFELVLCFWAVPAGLLAFAGKYSIPGFPPYVIWALGSDINSLKNKPVGRWILRRILRGARARYADGLQLAQDVSAISGKDCEFLPTFRALSPDAESDIEKVEIYDEPVRFLFVGRHELVKGIDVLVEAMIRAIEQASRKKNLGCDIIGSGSLHETLKEKVAASGFEKKIRFLGTVSDDDLNQHYKKADCVIIPSRSESIPIVFGEAAQFRKAMIVTDVGDMGTLSKKFDLGKVCSPENATELTRAILDFAEAPYRPSRENASKLLDFLSLERKIPQLSENLNRMTAR